MDREPTKTAVREANRERRLGVDECANCGKSGFEKLRQVSHEVRKFLIEQHHVLGRALDSNRTSPLCLNCHAEATESMRRNGVPMRPQSNVLDRLIGCKRAEIASLEDVSHAAERFLQELEELVCLLDAKVPRWRKHWKNRK